MTPTQSENLVYTSINYAIHEVCCICEYGKFVQESQWGLCETHKSTKGHLSIHRAGRCEDWELQEGADLGVYQAHMANNSKEDRAVTAIKRGLGSR